MHKLKTNTHIASKKPQLCTIAGYGHCSASPGNISNSNVFPSTLNNRLPSSDPEFNEQKQFFQVFSVKSQATNKAPKRGLRLATRDPQPLAAPASPVPGLLPSPQFPGSSRPAGTPSTLRPGQVPTCTLSGRNTDRSPDQGHRATRKHSGPPLVQTNTVKECPLYDTRTLPWSLQTSALLLTLGRPCRARRATAKSLARGLHKYLT